MQFLGQFDIAKLLEYGLGTAMTVVLVFAMIYFMNKLVNGLGRMVQEQGVTLKDIANTLSHVQTEIKELREGQESLWGAVRKVERKVMKDNKGGQNNG